MSHSHSVSETVTTKITTLIDVARFFKRGITINVFPPEKENHLCRCQVYIDDVMLRKYEGVISCYGSGNTVQNAINDYVSEIRGKNLVKLQYKDNVQEMLCPENLQTVQL